MKIWKWTLEITDQQTISMPIGSKPLSVGIQYEKLQLWAICDEAAKHEDRVIAIYGTGNPIPNDPGSFIGTFQISYGTLVFHVFDLGGG